MAALMPHGENPATLLPEVMAFASSARNWLLGSAAGARDLQPGSRPVLRILVWLVLLLAALLLLGFFATRSNKAAVSEAIPAGAATVASMVDSAPALKVFFDTGKADLSPDFTARARPVLSHLSTHEKARLLVVSGFSDANGSTAVNEDMSMRRAQAVADALIAAGAPEARILLERPENIIGTGATDAAALRVEVVVQE